MRAGGEYQLRVYPHFTSIAATAEATTLADHSVDFVTAGQAFHWFDHERARQEFARILAARGWVVLVWNFHRTTETPFLVALEQFWQKDFTRERPHDAATDRDSTGPFGWTKPAESRRSRFERARREVIGPFFEPGAFREKVFDNPLVCDWDGLKGRVLSNRIALEDEDPRLTAMLEELEGIVKAHQVDGRVTIEQDLYVIYGRLGAATQP